MPRKLKSFKKCKERNPNRLTYRDLNISLKCTMEYPGRTQVSVQSKLKHVLCTSDGKKFAQKWENYSANAEQGTWSPRDLEGHPCPRPQGADGLQYQDAQQRFTV